MASNGEEVRQAALRELARRELERRRTAVPAQSGPKTMLEARGRPANWREILATAVDVENNPLARNVALTGRAIAEGVADVAAPFANAVRSGANLGLQAIGADFRFPEQSEHVSRALTDVGFPQPESGIERGANVGGRIGASMIAGGAPLTSAVMSRLGLRTPRTVAPPPRPAATPAAQTLQRAGVPLDRSQRQGGRFLQMLRSAVTNHPFTAERQAHFSAAQQKEFNRAVLRSIGANADEATQSVMTEAKSRIGSVFDNIGKQGLAFDDALQAQTANIVDDALATVPQSELAPLMRNIDDLLNAVDDSGRINGDVFTRIRSRLSELARRPGIGQSARRLEDALMDALERSHPGQRQALRDAADQWRNMRIIEQAIGKGAERDISPLRLSNAIGTARNRAMSVYGQGGDQQLVELAQAGRSVLPEVLPDSGTVPRGMMQAPLRSIVTAPIYRAAQNYLLAQPKALPPGYGVRNVLIPSGAAVNELLAR